MLMSLGLGALPSNLTVPLRVAVPAALLAEVGGLPTSTACPLQMQIITVKAAIRMGLFVVMQPNLPPLTHRTRFFSLRIWSSSGRRNSVRKAEEGVVIQRSMTRHFLVIFLPGL